jgi:hypothetical protein
LTTLEALWKWRLGVLGKSVVVEGIDQQLQGRLLEVTLAGLDLEIEPGEIVSLPPEKVKHIHASDGA